MQIDFHHTVTYVVARLAGFNHNDADKISYAAQYVDDTVVSGVVRFDNNAMYQRISSSHKSMDIINLDNDENHLVWIPFHFLPGNGGLPADKDPKGTFIHKIICSPNSPIAKEMVQSAFDDNDKPYGLFRLGIAMHVYADTWAHQGFAGVLHEVNHVHDPKDIGKSRTFKDGLAGVIRNILVDTVPSVGHGRALKFPDMPFLSWTYMNGFGKLITRNNTDLFLSAADAMFTAMSNYRNKTATTALIINKKDRKQIQNLFTTLKSEEGRERHAKWIVAIKDGKFSFGSADLSYAEQGEFSWKAQALGTSDDITEYQYSESFLSSNWKLFHDALQKHRLTVLHDILPKYGICAG